MEADGSPETVVAEASDAESTRPRALIHKKILGAARADPDASTSQIATAVSGASVDLVEQVLEEYGDPAVEDQSDAETPTDNAPPDAETPADDRHEPETDPDPSELRATGRSESDDASDEQPVVDRAALGEKQRETLQAIHERPTATQAEIAEALGVSRATIPKRLNDIPGFDWPSRREFVERLFESNRPEAAADRAPPASITDSLDELATRIESLEAGLERGPRRNGAQIEPELLRKLVHASMDAEYISQEEELTLLKQLLPDSSDY
jgi:DNA-binding MarR family transcriptional regulator